MFKKCKQNPLKLAINVLLRSNKALYHIVQHVNVYEHYPVYRIINRLCHTSGYTCNTYISSTPISILYLACLSFILIQKRMCSEIYNIYLHIHLLLYIYLSCQLFLTKWATCESFVPESHSHPQTYIIRSVNCVGIF